MPPVVHIKSIRDQVKSLVPNPKPAIVNRLISYYESPNFTIRSPLSTTPQTRYYDLENVKFFARILTMLQDMGIFPPPVSQSQGGVPGTFDGPLVFATGSSSASSLRHPANEIEMQQNALSSEPGSLVDAANNLNTEVEFEGRPQVEYVAQRWVQQQTQTESKINLPRIPPIGASNDEFVSYFDSLQTAFNSGALRASITDSQQIEEELDLKQVDLIDEEEFEMNIQRPLTMLQRASVWSQSIRRRLPYSRATVQQRRDIQTELMPIWTIADDDLEEFSESKEQLPPPNIRTWWRNLSPIQRARNFAYYRELAAFLLIPVGILVQGIALHKNLESQSSDPLMELYYKLSSTNFFKANFTALDWAFVITRTDRKDNFRLMNYLQTDPNYYNEDVLILWEFHLKIVDNNSDSVPWFIIFREMLLFRADNNDLIKVVLKSTLFKPYEWLYILNAIEYAHRFWISNYVSAQIVLTERLQTQVKDAKTLIYAELMQPVRQEKFIFLMSAFKDALTTSNVPDFALSEDWQKHAMKLFKESYFYLAFSDTAFKTLLYELTIHHELYSRNATDVVTLFLHRFNAGPNDDVVTPFNDLSIGISSSEDPSNYIHQTLQAMNNYYNEGLDTLAYMVINNHFQTQVVSCSSFGEAVQRLNLPRNFPAVASLQILSALSYDALGFLKKVQTDVNQKTEPPGSLPSVNLFRQGLDSNYFIPASHIVQHGRSLKSVAYATTDIVLYEPNNALYIPWNELSFVRCLNYTLTVWKDYLVAIVDSTVDKGRDINIILFRISGADETGLIPKSDGSVVIYSKHMTPTPTGVVLKDDHWISKEMDLIVGTGLTLGVIILTDHFFEMDIGIVLTKFTGNIMKTALISYSKMSFKNQVIVGSISSAAYVYGPSKIYDKAKEITNTILGAGPALSLVVLLTGVAFMASNLSSLSENKKRKR